MEIALDEAADRRIAGLRNELSFWEDQISGKGLYSASVLSRLDLSKQPPEYRYDFEPLILQLGLQMGRKARILDVGSGPASIFSWGYCKNLFDLVAVDPLALEFVHILKRYGFEATSPMHRCGGEDVVAAFGNDYFDFIWSFNSFDRGESPKDMLHAMTSVLRPGGILAIQCAENEGSALGWPGINAFDITKGPQGALICTSMDGSTESIVESRLEQFTLPFTQAYVPNTSGRDWLAVFYRRI
jgi:SAM-dependent methyltransferase